MISIYELQPGSLLRYNGTVARVCMLDAIDESLMIALPGGQHKMIHKDTMHKLEPMDITPQSLKITPAFKKNAIEVRMGNSKLFLKPETDAVVLEDSDRVTIIRFFHIRAVHQLQYLYKSLTGQHLSVVFDHFSQEA